MLAKRRFQIFPLFQACVGNFHTIRPWKVVGTLNVDSSYVTFKCFAFLSICDKFEFLGHVQVTTMIWVLFLSLFLDLLLVTVSGFIGLFRSTCYFNLFYWIISVNLLLQPFFLVHFGVYPGLPGSTPVSFPFMSRWKSRWNLRDRLSYVAELLQETGWETCRSRSRSRREASNAKSTKSLFHFKPEKVNKFESCNNLWKQNIFRNPERKLKAWL